MPGSLTGPAAQPVLAPARLGPTARQRLALAATLGPALLVALVGFVVPAVLLLVKSFAMPTGYGQVHWAATVANYIDAFSNPVYLRVTETALGIGALAGLLCTAASYPFAYFLTFRAGRGKNVLLLLVVASLFTSYLVRIYAWRTILGYNGLINTALEQIGLISHPLTFLLFSPWAILITFLNTYIPYAILMVAASMQTVPAALLENSRDLGASSFTTFRRVLLPLTAPGAIGAFTYTFILTAGDYLTPRLVGGTGSTMTGVVISDQFLALGNEPAGAALSFILLALLGLVYAAITFLPRLRRA